MTVRTRVGIVKVAELETAVRAFEFVHFSLFFPGFDWISRYLVNAAQIASRSWMHKGGDRNRFVNHHILENWIHPPTIISLDDEAGQYLVCIHPIAAGYGMFMGTITSPPVRVLERFSDGDTRPECVSVHPRDGR